MSKPTIPNSCDVCQDSKKLLRECTVVHSVSGYTPSLTKTYRTKLYLCRECSLAVLGIKDN